MKLIFDLLAFERGKSYGFEEYISNILTYVVDHRQEIAADRIIIACLDTQVKYFESLCDNKIEIFGISARNMINRFLKSRIIPKLLKASEEDVIFYPGNYMPYFSSSKAKKILVIHDLLFRHSKFCSKKIAFSLLRLQRYLYVPKSLKEANKVIAISNYTHKEIIDTYNISRNKVTTIYNYFNFDKYNDNSKRTISDISGDYFLSVCSKEKHKNHIVLLKAFEHIAIDDKEIKFVLVGSLNPDVLDIWNSWDDELRNRFIIVKHISNSDFYYLYTHAKAYISASKYEGLGMPVVEALYFGLNSFLSDIEIHREVSFNSAQYFNCDDWKELANLMKHPVSNKSVRNLVEERYSALNTSDKYCKVFNEILNA